MIKVKIGDLFDTEATTIVNTVNCVGVMGKGIAQSFKKRFPDMYKDYKKLCEAGKIEPGVPYLYKDMLGVSVVNFPTKKHWRSPSRLDYVTKGLDLFIDNYKDWDVQSVAFPPLGCGNGGLEWAVVGPIMYQRLSNLDIPVEIFAPYGTPGHQLTERFLNKPIASGQELINGARNREFNVSWVALLEVLDRLQQQPYANPVGRTIFQKISYILTEQGVDTGFSFKQGSYGPFSSEVKEAISVFANANLVQERQLGRMTALHVSSDYEPIKKKYAEQLKSLDKKVEKTVDLFSRIKSTSQAEEVTTVLFAARQLKKDSKDISVSEKDIYDYVLSWKKQWQKEEKRIAVASTIRNLEMLGWMRLRYSEGLPTAEEI